MKKQVLKIVAGASLCFLHGGLSALIFAPYSSYAQVPSYVPSNGLMGYWPFNGNANDESGNSNNGTVNGATLTTDRFGNANKAYSFDGVNDIINLPINSAKVANSVKFSIQYWVIPDSKISTPQTIFSNWHSNPNVSLGSSVSYFTGFYGNNSGYNIFSGYVNNYGVGSNLAIDFNNWNHIVIVYDGSQTQSQYRQKVYYNGVLESNNFNCANCLNDIPQIIGNVVNHTTIGARYAGSLNSIIDAFKGPIDDIGIWNRALSQQEITALYKGCNVSASVNAQSNTTFCQGGSVTLQANTGNNYTYEWYKNGTPIPNANQRSYVANSSGNYTVKVSEGACNATSAATAVTVNANPSVSINSIGSITNYFAAPVNLSGSPSGGTFSGAGVNGNKFNPKQAGLGTRKITYAYTNANNCSGTASTSTLVYDTLGTTCTKYISVTDTLIIKAALAGLTPPNNENTLKVYPNPASTHITIDNGDFAKMSGYSVKITNNVGQQVFQSAINQAKFYVDLSSWSGKGLYFVHLIDPQNNTVTVRKIVLQ